MSEEERALLRVGDVVEFHCSSNSPPKQEWQAERVKQIRICEEFDDKEGVRVESATWHDVLDYQCLVVVVGERHWGNGDIRPITTG